MEITSGIERIILHLIIACWTRACAPRSGWKASNSVCHYAPPACPHAAAVDTGEPERVFATDPGGPPQAMKVSGEGNDKPLKPEEELPIDINYAKLHDWLSDRQKVKADWRTKLQLIRQKVAAAIENLPDNPQLNAVKAGVEPCPSHNTSLVFPPPPFALRAPSRSVRVFALGLLHTTPPAFLAFSSAPLLSGNCDHAVFNEEARDGCNWRRPPASTQDSSPPPPRMPSYSHTGAGRQGGLCQHRGAEPGGVP